MPSLRLSPLRHQSVESLSNEVDALARDFSLVSKPGGRKLSKEIGSEATSKPTSCHPSSGEVSPGTGVVEHLQSELQVLLGMVSEQARRIAEQAMEAQAESCELRQRVEAFLPDMVATAKAPRVPPSQHNMEVSVFESIEDDSDASPLPGQAMPSVPKQMAIPSNEPQKSANSLPDSGSTPFAVVPQQQQLQVSQEVSVFESVDDDSDESPRPAMPGQATPSVPKLMAIPSNESQKSGNSSLPDSGSTPLAVVPQQQLQVPLPSGPPKEQGPRHDAIESRRLLMQWKKDLENQNRQVAKDLHLQAQKAERGGQLAVPLPASDRDDEVVSQTSMFNGAEAVKDEIRKALYKKEYNVVNFYKHAGMCQLIARHHFFEMFVLALIGANCIWIAVETDQNREAFLISAHWPFQVGENLFCAFFTLELLIRFGAFRRKCDALKDTWFLFDAVLVMLMVVETWGMYLIVAVTGSSESFLGNASFLRVVRVLRLLRTARMAKLMRAMPELMLLVRGMAVACRSVLFTLLLLMIFVYVFAIVCMQIARDTDLELRYFPRFHDAILTLLFEAVLPDLNLFMRSILDESFLFAMIMMAFILLGHVTVMNMLVGVLVEVIKTVSEVEREQMEVHTVKRTFHDMITKMNLDEDGDSRISREEFVSLLTKPEAAKALTHIGVDAVALLDYQDHLFGMDGEEVLTFGEFMEAILELRGSNMAKVKDIVDLRKFVAHEVSCLYEVMGLDPLSPGPSNSFRRTSAVSKQGGRRSLRNLESSPRGSVRRISTSTVKSPGQSSHMS